MFRPSLIREALHPTGKLPCQEVCSERSGGATCKQNGAVWEWGASRSHALLRSFPSSRWLRLGRSVSRGEGRTAFPLFGLVGDSTSATNDESAEGLNGHSCNVATAEV